MRLDALAVAIRPRHAYEAADLGVAFAARHAAALGRLGLVFVLPLTGLGLLLEHLGHVSITVLLLWWLTPVFDYAVLWYLSQAAFGDRPAARAVLAAFPGFFGKGLAGTLLWRRLSFSRAFILPVRLLEGLPQRDLAARIRLLRRGLPRSRQLHMVFGLFEAAIFLMLLFFFCWVLPGFNVTLGGFDALGGHPGSPGRDLVVCLYALTIGIAEPLYVGAGFMVYLNRRAELEAWDVEIALRRLVSQLPASREAA